MQEKSLIKKNILKFLDSKGISKYEFYKQTGITRGILDQNNGMNEENTARFLAVYKEVSAEWLITDRGEMLKSQEDINKAPPDMVKVNKCSGCEMCTEKEKRIDALERTIQTQAKLINKYEEESSSIDEQKRKAG